MTYSQVIRKHVTGRKIVKVLLNRQYDSEREAWYYKPTIFLDNKVALELWTQETESGDYGTEILVFVPQADGTYRLANND